MWSAGYFFHLILNNFVISCFFGELLIGKELFQGEKESRQLELIYEKCGSPDEETWPGVQSLPYFSEMGPKRMYPRNLLSYMRAQRPKYKYY